MATEIEIDTIINTDRSEKGLGELRKGLKELISLQSQVGAGSEQFKKLQNAINETEGKIGDLTDSFQTLKGSGVERLNSSLGLLREGFASADPGKIKVAFEGLGAAMKAVPIFLLIEGVRLLIENFDKVTNLFKDLIDKTDQESIATQRLIDANKNLSMSYDEVASKIDRQIKLSQAFGSDQIEILELQVQKYNELNKSLSQQSDNYARLYAQGGEKAQEYYNLALEFEQKAINAANDGAAALLSIDRIKEQRQKESLERITRKNREELEKRNRDYEEYTKLSNDIVKKLNDFNTQQAIDKLKSDNQARIDLEKSRAEINKQIDDDLKANRLKNDQEEVASNKAKWDAEEENARKAAENQQKITQAQLQLAELSTQSLLNLSSAYFEYRSNAAKGDTKQQEEQAKKQFETFKKIQIAAAIISGIQGVINALTAKSTIPEPYGTIVKAATAVSIGAATALNIAKIKNTKFAASSSGGGSEAAPIPSINGGSGPSGQVEQQTPGAQTFNPTGLSNTQVGQRRQENRVYVLESDIRNTTNRVNVIESRATF